MFSAKEILDMAIRFEKNGENVYRRAVKTITHPELISLLEWMAEEERNHARWFSDLKQDIENQSRNPFAEKMVMQSLNDIIGEQNFSLGDTDFSQVDDRDELIGIFVEFEQDTLLFYEMLQPFIEDKDILSRLQKIIREEKEHIRKLEAFRESSPEINFLPSGN